MIIYLAGTNTLKKHPNIIKKSSYFLESFYSIKPWQLEYLLNAKDFLLGLIMYKCKNTLVKIPVCSIIAGLIIGAELTLISGAPFVFTAITIAIGEAVALSMGGVLFRTIGGRKIQLWQDQEKK